LIKLLEKKEPIEYKIIKPRILPAGEIFFIDYTYGDGKKRVRIGKQVFVIGK